MELNQRVPTEQELSLQGMWDRAASKAITTGFPPMMVYTSMFAAATERLRAELGEVLLAQYLGTLAVEAHKISGGPIEDEDTGIDKC